MKANDGSLMTHGQSMGEFSTLLLNQLWFNGGQWSWRCFMMVRTSIKTIGNADCEWTSCINTRWHQWILIIIKSLTPLWFLIHYHWQQSTPVKHKLMIANYIICSWWCHHYHTPWLYILASWLACMPYHGQRNYTKSHQPSVPIMIHHLPTTVVIT